MRLLLLTPCSIFYLNKDRSYLYLYVHLSLSTDCFVVCIIVHAYMYSGDAIYWNISRCLIGYWLYHGGCASCIKWILYYIHNSIVFLANGLLSLCNQVALSALLSGSVLLALVSVSLISYLCTAFLVTWFIPESLYMVCALAYFPINTCQITWACGSWGAYLWWGHILQ